MRQAPGVVEATFQKLFTKTARCASVERVGDFSLVTLEGEALLEASWKPGDKLEVFVDRWVKRTYTPMSWRDGRVELLAHAHGEAPGAHFARSVQAGDSFALIGPRRSLSVDAIERPAMLFGDETSIGLIYALRSTTSGRNVVHVAFEVTSIESVRPVLDRLELDAIHLVERKPDDEHLTELCTWTIALTPLAGAVLSGKASSIQTMNRCVRARGLTSRQIVTRAYWATGKRGLD